MKRTKPLVSVIIPTKNRPHLVTRAVCSAFAQTLAEVEVIVVIDGPDEATLQALNQMDDPRLRVRTLPRQFGAAYARNTGVREARSRWVAYLDDDDEWFPEKLELQIQTAQTSVFLYPIIACRLIGRSEAGDSVWPRRIKEPTESLSEYLFCRKNLSWGEGVIQSSVIFSTKALLQKVPARSEALLHEDLDWLLRASLLKGAGVEFVPCNEPLVIWHIEENRSRMSNNTSWHDSFEWIQGNRHLVTPHAYASFIMTWISTFAARRREWKAIMPLLREAYRHGKPTLMDVLVFCGNWLLPRRVQREIASFVKKKDPLL
jgi:glycosyltransferase involved in cell wall biosynthesis